MKNMVVFLGLLLAGCASNPPGTMTSDEGIVCATEFVEAEMRLPAPWKFWAPKGLVEDPCAGSDLIQKIRTDKNFWPLLVAVINPENGISLSVGLWSPNANQAPVTLGRVATINFKKFKKYEIVSSKPIPLQDREPGVQVEKILQVVKVPRCGRGRAPCEMEWGFARVVDERTRNQFFFIVGHVDEKALRSHLTRKDGVWVASGVHEALEESLAGFSIRPQ